MERFNTLLEAAEAAATLCTGWSFNCSDEKYDTTGLLGISEIHDKENPADEDSFYVVSPAGAIGFCEDGEDIDWLFLADLAPNEALPDKFQTGAEIKFCPKCGAAIVPGARFCGKCGGRL